MVLFLDFDGVLHPEILGQLDDFSCGLHLWNILRACPNVDVVFSTSWKGTYPVDELIAFATQGGGEDLAHRFIGTTPSVVREKGANYTGQYYRRETECRLWLAGNNRLESWVALDDFAPYFSPACPSLCLIDQKTGLTEADAAMLIERLTEGIL